MLTQPLSITILGLLLSSVVHAKAQVSCRHVSKDQNSWRHKQRSIQGRTAAIVRSYRGGYEDIDDDEYEEEDEEEDEEEEEEQPSENHYAKSNQQQLGSSTETPRQRPQSDFSASPSRQIGGGGGGGGGLKDSSDDGAARIQWMITQKMRSGLLRLNYLPDEIKAMDPHVAKILLERRLSRPRTGMPISWRRGAHRQSSKRNKLWGRQPWRLVKSVTMVPVRCVSFVVSLPRRSAGALLASTRTAKATLVFGALVLALRHVRKNDTFREAEVDMLEFEDPFFSRRR